MELALAVDVPLLPPLPWPFEGEHWHDDARVDVLRWVDFLL